MGTQMWGADPDALDRLADQFVAAADRLTAIQRNVGLRVHMAPWGGSRGAGFVRDWDGPQRQRLGSAVQALREGARDLRGQADQQRKAGAVAGGASVSAGAFVAAGAAKVWSMAEGASKVKGVTDVLNTVRKRGYDPTSKALQHLTGDGDLFKWRKSPVIKGLESVVREPSGAAKALKAVDHVPLLGVVGYVSLGNEAWNVGSDVASGHYGDAASGAVHLVGSAAQNIPNPVTYIAGFDVKLAQHVVTEGKKIDWSPNGLDAVLHPGPGAAKAVWDAEVEGLGRIVPDLF